MNLARALALKSGDVLVSVQCGRASVMLGGLDDLIIPYQCGERAYVVRCDSDSPEAVRIADKQALGRINLRNWEPVTLCDYCMAESGEHELKECDKCGARQCWECAVDHANVCTSGTSRNNFGRGNPPRRQKPLTFKLPRRFKK